MCDIADVRYTPRTHVRPCLHCIRQWLLIIVRIIHEDHIAGQMSSVAKPAQVLKGDLLAIRLTDVHPSGDDDLHLRAGGVCKVRARQSEELQSPMALRNGRAAVVEAGRAPTADLPPARST